MIHRKKIFLLFSWDFFHGQVILKIVADFGENHEIQKLDQILNPLSERHIAMATLHTFCRCYADKTKRNHR